MTDDGGDGDGDGGEATGPLVRFCWCLVTCSNGFWKTRFETRKCQFRLNESVHYALDDERGLAYRHDDITVVIRFKRLWEEATDEPLVINR